MYDKLTYEELHFKLMYNPWDGYFYWKNPSKYCKSKTWSKAGSLDVYNYIVIGINGKKYGAHRLAWFYVYGYMPEGMIDHKDRVRYNNRIKNLREASDQCSVRNRGKFKNNISGITGIHWSKRDKNWSVNISVNYKRKFLGCYKSFDEAVCARLAGEQCLNWSGCDSSSPAYKYVKENIQCMQ